MATEQRYTRDANGTRFEIGGINTIAPLDAMPTNRYPYLQNVRRLLLGRVTGRPTQGAPVLTLPYGPHTLRRLNDSTPNGPVSGSAFIGGAGTSLYCNANAVATGLSGNRLALVPFRPNSSPQPWMYVADSNKMLKVRSDGLTYKMGIKEPQNAPIIGTETTTVTGSVVVLGTARPWSNTSGANPTFNYGDTGDGTGSVVIDTPTAGATLTITATGTATISGVQVQPGSAGGAGPSNPGHFIPSPAVLVGAWTDANGTILLNLPNNQASVVSVGASLTVTVPVGAAQFQLGVDGTGGAFSGNSGQFAANYSLATSAVATVVSLLGNVTAYYWGDSPHTGPVAAYIWKNPADTAGSGPTRSIGDAAGMTTGNSLQFDTTPAGSGAAMLWDVLDETGTVTGQNPVFQPALESQGYQDFNMCVTGNLFFPAAGTYTLAITSKDNVMVGIGNNATWPGIGTIKGESGQTMTVVSKLPLLPSPAISGSGAAQTVSVQVTVPGPGIYPIEGDYDYWYHSGRTFTIKVNGATIPPLSSAVKQSVAYRYRYRSSATGAKSNPSPASPAQQVPAISNTIGVNASTDPQVDKIDYFRMDATLDDFTYVGTGPNPPAPFTDQLLDQDVAGNLLLEYDNFEPFPSIDLPRKGVVNVIGGVAEWVSGDQFNLRWLPGTIINIGGIAYTLYNRPQSATTLTPVDAQDGTNLVFEIAAPTLAGQPLASMWGNTDNTAYAFACGDPLRPGTLYYCKGNDLDSAPDTNQIEVTSPTEPLINGCIENGIGMVMSAENGWVIYPAFSNAVATVTGVEGNAFTMQRSNLTRGLYIRPCICTDGSGRFFYRSKDGIEACAGTGEQKSLTDDDLFNLFSHEGSTAAPVTIAGFTLYPPDDSQPEKQSLTFATGYLYYDYLDTTGTPRTLVFDTTGTGWIVDAYEHPVTLHVLEEGAAVNGTLVACADGTVRPLGTANGENSQAVVLTAAQNGGDARAGKSIGDVFLRAQVTGAPVAVTPWASMYTAAISGASPATLAPGTGLQSYIVDFTDGDGRDVQDIELALSWKLGTTTFLDLWQPDWTSLPESVQDRPTDWTDAGNVGPMFVQGLTLEADTFGQAKAIAVQSGDDLSLHVPDQSPLTFNGQSKQTLTFTPPFVASTVRILTTDGVPWRYFGAAWQALPFPPAVTQWQTEMSALGLDGWMHVRELNIAHISTADLTLTLMFDPGAYPQTMVLTIPHSAGRQAKTKVTAQGPNKFKLVSFRLSSSQPFRVFEKDMECKIGQWGRSEPYRNMKVIGGASAEGAQL